MKKILIVLVYMVLVLLFLALVPTRSEAPVQTIQPEQKIPKIMQDIAFCESENRQFNDDGSVVLGKQNSLDTGRFQINQKYHLAKSKELNMDIFTLEGNTAYAMYLYEREGTRPWNWSKDCWQAR